MFHPEERFMLRKWAQRVSDHVRDNHIAGRAPEIEYIEKLIGLAVDEVIRNREAVEERQKPRPF